MHEWALADAVLTAAAKAAKDGHLTSVDEVIVVLGELQNVDLEAFPALFDEIKKSCGNVFKSAVMKIEREKAAFSCRACGTEFLLDDVRNLGPEEAEAIHFVPELAGAYMKCPSCKSPDFKITKGRGVYIKEIKGEK